MLARQILDDAKRQAESLAPSLGMPVRMHIARFGCPCEPLGLFWSGSLGAAKRLIGLTRFAEVVLSLVAISPLNASLGAQATAAAPRFEVASIKLSPPDAHMTIGLELRHGRLTGAALTLRKILATAYGMTSPQIIGPDWLDKDRFDVLAKSPEDVPDSEMKPMVQLLLQDRFHLVAHQEKMEMSVYDLLIAKGGIKMAVYPAAEHAIVPGASGTAMIRGRFTMPRLANTLSQITGKPVINKTGLLKTYNLVLTFVPLSSLTADAAESGPDLLAHCANSWDSISCQREKMLRPPLSIISPDYPPKIRSPSLLYGRIPAAPYIAC